MQNLMRVLGESRSLPCARSQQDHRFALANFVLQVAWHVEPVPTLPCVRRPVDRAGARSSALRVTEVSLRVGSNRPLRRV